MEDKANLPSGVETAGNGIVERHHRSVKAMADRGHRNPMVAVYWYKMSPMEGQEED